MLRQAGKFGLRPVPHGLKWKLQFHDYVDITQLPPIPAGDYGHIDLLTQPLGMYLNDTYGDCVVAGAEHETRLYVAEGTGSDTVVFDDNATVANYTLLGNFNPNDPVNSDQGCDMLTAASLRITQGIIDASGNRHKLGIALQLQPGNWEQLLYAIRYFDGVGLGILVTPQMQDAFNNSQPWDLPQFNPNNVEGGHYVTAVCRKNGLPNVITWGGLQPLTRDLYTAPQFSTVTLAYASQEKLRNGTDLEGLSWSDMRADLPKLLQVA